MLRALCAVAVLLAAAGAAASDLNRSQARTFETICAHCHVPPGIGVPLLGDEAAWEPRRAKGFEALLRNTVEGFGAMPPLGTCGYCSEEDLRALVAFLAGMTSGPAPESAAP